MSASRKEVIDRVNEIGRTIYNLERNPATDLYFAEYKDQLGKWTTAGTHYSESKAIQQAQKYTARGSRVVRISSKDYIKKLQREEEKLYEQLHW